MKRSTSGGRGEGGSHGIAVVVVEQSIDGRVVGETTGEGIKGSVLLDQDDHILDVVLPVVVVVAVPNLGRLRDGEHKARQGYEGNNARANHLDLIGEVVTNGAT